MGIDGELLDSYSGLDCQFGAPSLGVGPKSRVPLERKSGTPESTLRGC